MGIYSKQYARIRESMKKKTRRFLLFFLLLIIPAMAIGGYTLYTQFEGNLSDILVFLKTVPQRDVKDLIFGRFIKENDGRSKTDNDGALIEEEEKPDSSIPVTVFKAFITGFRDTLPALGTLKGYRETKLGFEKSGIIKVFNYKAGDLVPEGALICSLQKSDSEITVRHAEAKIAEANSTLSLAKNKLERATQKYELGGTSKSLYEEAMLEYEKSTHQLETAKIELEDAKLELNKCDVFAPYEGILGNKYVEIGETITMNTLVCDLIDVEYMIVGIGVVERDIEKLQIGQRVSIFVDAYPNREFVGSVETLSPVVEGQSRTFSVEIKVANPQKVLLPGMFARVRINVFEKNNALIIPTSALNLQKNKYTTFVVNPDSMGVTERPISVIYATTDYAVISRGLKVGELVVIGEKEGVSEGMTVKIVEEQVPEM